MRYEKRRLNAERRRLGDKQRDPGPVFRSVMGKSETVHRPRHLNISEQYMDASGVVFEHAQSGVGMLGFHHLKAGIAERLGHDKANQLFVLSDQDQDLVRHVFSLRSRTRNGWQSTRLPFLAL